jgi:PilZ domain-containing protein
MKPAATMYRNKRREIRRALRMGCRVVRESNLRLVGDRTVDLSPEGLLVLSDERIDANEELIVSFMATDLGIWFDTMARVSRVVEGRRDGDAGRAVGVRFTSLPAVSRLILRGNLRRVPPPLPRRPRVRIDVVRPPVVDYARIIREIACGLR